MTTEKADLSKVLMQLEATIATRQTAEVGTSYVATLNAKGLDAILKKIGEEATETVIAAKSGDRDQIIYESADLLFHLLVLLQHQKISFDEVLAELQRREGTSGIAEKNARK
jgi:phosphoribosyl-ATP pyrophosphohydrolase